MGSGTIEWRSLVSRQSDRCNFRYNLLLHTKCVLGMMRRERPEGGTMRFELSVGQSFVTIKTPLHVHRIVSKDGALYTHVL